jgi:hypothetical protein
VRWSFLFIEIWHNSFELRDCLWMLHKSVPAVRNFRTVCNQTNISSVRSPNPPLNDTNVVPNSEVRRFDAGVTEVRVIYFRHIYSCRYQIASNWLTDWLTDYMKQSHSSEANSRSPNQEIVIILWNPNDHYRVYNSPPLVPVPSQMNPVHTFSHYFPKIHSNIILSPSPRSS